MRQGRPRQMLRILIPFSLYVADSERAKPIPVLVQHAVPEPLEKLTSLHAMLVIK